MGKLELFKEGGGERHIRDIRAMLEVDDAGIDRVVFDRWVAACDRGSVWEIIRDS